MLQLTYHILCQHWRYQVSSLHAEHVHADHVHADHVHPN